MPEATVYESLYRREGLYWRAEPSSMCDRVLAILPPRADPPVRLIDLGCGEGRNVLYLASKGYAATGVDLAAAGLDKMRRWAERSGLVVQALHASILTLALPLSYDVIFSTGTLHYLPAAMREARFADYRAHTAPGGLNALSVFVEKPWLPRAPDSEPGEYTFRSGELLGYYWDWEILWCTEELFDCHSGGIPHQHCMDRIIARKR